LFLQNLLLKIKTVTVENNPDFTAIKLMLPGINDNRIDKIYNISLVLCYDSVETRPYALTTDDNDTLFWDITRRLNNFFKPFLKNDLCSALLQISIYDKTAEFVWQNAVMYDNEDNMETYEEVFDPFNIGCLDLFLRRNKNRERNLLD